MFFGSGLMEPMTCSRAVLLVLTVVTTDLEEDTARDMLYDEKSFVKSPVNLKFWKTASTLA